MPRSPMRPTSLAARARPRAGGAGSRHEHAGAARRAGPRRRAPRGGGHRDLRARGGRPAGGAAARPGGGHAGRDPQSCRRAAVLGGGPGAALPPLSLPLRARAGGHARARRAGRGARSSPSPSAPTADLRTRTSTLALAPDDEIAALSVMRAVALGNTLGELPRASSPPAAEAAARLVTARYAVIVHDAEPGAERGATPTAPRGSSRWRRRSTGPPARRSARFGPAATAPAPRRC